jgi:hypothetical protein
MSVEFDSRFVALLETERQRFDSGSSRRQTGELDSLSVRGPRDGFGGRFDNSPRVVRRETRQVNIERSTIGI